MSDRDRKLKLFRVSSRVLLDVLNGRSRIEARGLPRDARVVAVRDVFTRAGLDFLVESDAYPAVPEGEVIPDGSPACVVHLRDDPPGVPDRVPFNVNMPVRVRLTEEGRRVHCEYYLYSHAPERDHEGWTKYQFHELMRVFGPHAGITSPLLFETNVELLPNG